MKLSFNLKKQEATLTADVEKLVEKSIEYNAKKPDKKTRYQIKQEEKRKTEELKHKQQMQYLYILLGLIAVFAVIGIITSVLKV